MTSVHQENGEQGIVMEKKKKVQGSTCKQQVAKEQMV
jgi:hypothetical protein